MDWKQRCKILRKWAKELDRRKYDLGMAALYEVGKSRLEAIGEAEEAVDLIDWYCDEMERNKGFARPMNRAARKEETHVPPEAGRRLRRHRAVQFSGGLAV